MHATDEHRWLSEGAEALLQLPKAAKASSTFDCDVLIVGSGYGGAVAAAALAGATPIGGGDKIRVFVLERGQEYLPGAFPKTFAEVPGHVRFSVQDGEPPRGRPEGLFDMRIGDDVHVLLGSGLGGGSLINAAVMERPTDDAFASPRWPAGVDQRGLDDGYRLAIDMLQPQPVRTRPRKLESLMKAGRAMRAEERRPAHLAIAQADCTTPAGVSVSRCVNCGDCASGCNHQAKQSLDTNYLARAQANGARLFCGATVHCVRPHDGGWEVEWHFTSRHKNRAGQAAFVLRAHRVILAAGALGSTEILQRSKRAGLAVSEAVGNHFSTNGDMIAAACRQRPAAHCSEREGTPPRERHVGPTITGLVRRRAANVSRPFVFQEFAIPAPLRRLLGEVIATFDTVHSFTDFDASTHRPNETMDDPLAVSDAVLEHTAIYGIMGDDGANGRLRLESARTPHPTDGQIRVDWPQLKHAGVFDAQLGELAFAHRSLGGRVFPNPMWRPLPSVGGLSLPPGPVMTVHPLGGCPMSDRVEDGVVDSYGRVYVRDAQGDVFEGLAVLDGSIVPVALGINPALTIAALAERAMPVLMRCWQVQRRETTHPKTEPRPVRRDANEVRTPAPTVIRLRERMTGSLVIAGERYEAELISRFADIADIARFVRSLPRSSHVEATLELVSERGVRHRYTLTGEAKILIRDKSRWWGRRTTRIMVRARERLRRVFPTVPASEDDGYRLLEALCSHVGGRRLITYAFRVKDGEGPLKGGDRVELVKRLEFSETGNPWRQLSEASVLVERRQGAGGDGTLKLDLMYFVKENFPLLVIDSQEDQPNALGDLAELGLFVLRVVLRIHLLNFLPPADQPHKTSERLPGAVDGVVPQRVPVTLPDGTVVPCLLSRYRKHDTDPAKRPIVMIHGYGASGSTFSHQDIPRNAVYTMLRRGREVWVLDLRTSIGLEQRSSYWSFEDVALGDIPPAVAAILRQRSANGLTAVPVDVLAHCIGAAMFCIAVLHHEDLRSNIGAVVLSQVGPLVAMPPMNAFRGYLAHYLRQYLSVETFDVRPRNPDSLLMRLVDAVLATFPYPDDDVEREKLKSVPGFARVRHRADAIFGQLMQLDRVGNDTLRALDAIYGWVNVSGLAQTIHFARYQMVTDASGINRWIARHQLAERFDFPLLIVHGRKNAVFDWRGSRDSLQLLDDVFAPEVQGARARRQCLFLDDYGHQDCMIGERSHADVFGPMVSFLDAFASLPQQPDTNRPLLVADMPWMGPMLGWVRELGHAVSCRIALLASPARQSSLLVVLVPAQRRHDGRWTFAYDHAVAIDVQSRDLSAERFDLQLRKTLLPSFGGFAVLTIHDGLPSRNPSKLILGHTIKNGLFIIPAEAPPCTALAQVRSRLEDPDVQVEHCIVRLDEAWLRAVDGASRTDGFEFVLASCQYPPGLFDSKPAQESYRRLCERIDAGRIQLMLLCGDQVYVDSTAGLFEPAPSLTLQHPYELNFRLDAFRHAVRARPTYFVIDDHEIRDNWEPSLVPDSEDVTAAKRAYWRNQHKLNPDWHRASPLGPYCFSAAPAGFPVFALDTRTSRDVRSLPPIPAGATPLGEARIVSLAVWKDLVRWLKSAPADVPKFLVMPSPLVPFEQTAIFGAEQERISLDTWGGFPRSAIDLLELVRDEPVRNLVLLTGDSHMSCVSTLRMEGPHGPVVVHAIMSSGMHTPWPFANTRADDLLLNGAFELRSGARSVAASIDTAILSTGAGFAIVTVTARPCTGWTLRVELDVAGGQAVAVKREFDLGGQPATRQAESA